jgi:ABC-2 type transport system ATP-binding protein
LKQRLFLAKTLLHKPKVLLLDEPATGLDPIARLDLRQQLKDLHAAGVTILISSHILSDLEEICTRVALISKGRNLTGVDGQEGIRMMRPSANTRLYEIEVLGTPEAAGEIINATAGAKLISADKERLRVEISGGSAEAASLLRHLVTSGVDIVSFDNHGASLETLYQKVFGAERP